jgi:hypothetical protein
MHGYSVVIGQRLIREALAVYKMKYIRYNWLFIIFCVFGSLEATPQVGEIIIIGTDTLTLRSLPLEPYLEKNQINFQEILENKGYGFSTCCYRRYQGYWILKNDSLFLVSIKACAPQGLVPEIDLSLIFDSRSLKKSPIFANWFSDTLTIPYGNKIHYEHSGWGWFYEKEVDIVLKKGVVLNRIEYDNSKSHISKYQKNPGLLQEFIKSKINWPNVPHIDSVETVFVKIFENKQNQIIAEVMKSSNLKLNTEALRVAYEIDDFTAIYSKGKRITWGLVFRIVFRENDRPKVNNESQNR